MNPHHSRLFFAISLLLVVAGCSESVSPPMGNLGIPPGATEGQYGFYINGRQFDNCNVSYRDGAASIQPFVIEGSGAVRLNISLFYNLSDGTYGTIDLNIPLLSAKPQMYQFSDAGSDWNPSAIGYYYIDTAGTYTDYRSIPGGTLTITKFDTVHNLVSGYFQFSAYELSPVTNLHNTATVSSGYFNDIPIDNGAYGQGSITATINDTPFDPDTAGIEMVAADSVNSAISIWAYGQGPLLNREISIQGIPIQTGSYVIDSSTARKYAMPFLIFWNWANTKQNIYTEQSVSKGLVTITSCNVATRRISGTFEFVGVDSLGNAVTISNGKINNVLWSP